MGALDWPWWLFLSPIYPPIIWVMVFIAVVSTIGVFIFAAVNSGE